jgi:SAM-dependent methyltransferase
MLDAAQRVCRVPFGTPLRKCVVASTEAHLRVAPGTTALEIGSHRHSHGRRIVEARGGTWTGIEPSLGPEVPARIGAGGYGHAAGIPFPDASFDLVFGNQSIEHWDEAHPHIPERASHEACLAEIARVLKSGGRLYLDAPIHLHGHEMFIRGDLARIEGLFDGSLWKDVRFERWRREWEPLERYPTPAGDRGRWPAELGLGDGVSVWLLVITATRR